MRSHWWYGGLTLLISAGLTAQTQPGSGELQRAAEEFRSVTRSMGLRADSPAAAKSARGGQNSQYHGRLYHNLRNDILDAIPKEIRQRGGGKNLLRRNQFGFNVSGPLIVPKLYHGGRRTFVSVTYEGVRERIGRSYLRTIATTPERTGDYSSVVDAAGAILPIYDPSTTAPNPAFDPSRPVSVQNLQYLRQPFPENRIPTARLDPVAQRMIAYYPQPNANAGPFFRNNYFSVSPETNRADGMILRLDHSFLEKHRLTTGFSFTNGFAGAARFFKTEADPGPADREYQNRRISAEHIFTITPKRINTLSAEAYVDISAATTAGDSIPEAIGLRGAGGDVFPLTTFGTYLGMGRANPEARNARTTYSLANSHSLRLASHNLRLAASLNHYQVNTFVPQYPSGRLQFSAGMTSLPGIVNTGHSFASFLLGAAEYAELSLVPSPSYFRTSRVSTGAHDTWEVAPGFNLTFGATLEVSTPRVEKYDRQSTVNLEHTNPANGLKGALTAASENGAGRGFQPVKTRVNPYANLAWNPGKSNRSVVRIAYGRSYQAVPLYTGQWGTQGFNGYSTYFSQNVQLTPAMLLGQGFPPPLRPLPDLDPAAANNTQADLMHPDPPLPRYQSASASYERQVPGSFVISAGVSSSWGRNLFVGNAAANPNAIPLEALRHRDQLNNEVFNRSLRPYPHFLGFDVYSLWPLGSYRRDAAFLRVEKRAAQGLTLNAYYEFAKQLDDYSGPYGTQDFFNRRNEWSMNPASSPHRISLSYMYELPIGTNKPFLAFQDWRRYFADGWSVSGISTLVTGEPLALRPQFNNTGGVVQSVRVNVVPGVDPAVPSPGPDMWFNPAAFSHPADFTIGNASRTHPTLRGPISQNHDLSLSKRFPIDAERTLEFNASGFNFINHANWNDPDVMIGTVASPNVNAGKIIGSRGGRVIQVGLRLSF